MVRMALKVAIIEADTTQRKVAREAGMPESRLSDIIRGWSMPRPDEREALARVLGRPVERLFDLADHQPTPGAPALAVTAGGISEERV
jgi:transcriptional regulator with XRE-family HTH domain